MNSLQDIYPSIMNALSICMREYYKSNILL